MTAFVLVHGSWHGAWCWHELVARLEAGGHDVLAPDLPSHGVDTAPPDAVSFDAYVDRICEAIDDVGEPAVLVGHSMGGHPVTQAAEERADAVDRLVYLTAFAPGDGQALTDLDFASHDSLVPEGIQADEARGVTEIDRDVAVSAFYHDCSPGQVALCRSLLRPEPIEPRTVSVKLTPERYGRVPTAYVECTADRALPISFQRELQGALEPDEVRTVETGHSPFLAAPGELADVLLDVASG